MLNGVNLQGCKGAYNRKEKYIKHSITRKRIPKNYK